MKNKSDPLQNLINEIRTWLQTIRYDVSEPKKFNDRTMDMLAILEFGILKQRVLVRCIEDEIILEDIEELSKLLNRKTPQGWLVSEKHISNKAREKAAKDDSIELFNLSEFLRHMVWGPYFNSLEALVEKSNIVNLYVDIGCYKQKIDEKEQDVGQERFSSLDTYVDKWLLNNSKKHISLLGGFGTGKTWFCRHYAYRQLDRYLKDPIHERLPLLITLRDFNKALTTQQLINDALLEQYKLPFLGSAYEVFQDMNRRGKLLLILDGFDEMARQVDYQTIVDNFWELANLVDGKSKVILTSRTEYFRWSKETEKILGGEEYGRKTLVLTPPKFDVLYLESLNDNQICEIIRKRKGTEEGLESAKSILERNNLAEMARKPVLIELLLEALDEVSIDILENPAQVYLFSTNKLLLRNIDTKRTFTSTADKLYFLSELAWEMIKNNELRIHYSDIPDKIREYFGKRISDQHELDTWDFDLRNQTLLHRNAAGYYEFAHKSLAEYFVAYKFAAELGCLSLEFIQTYEEIDNQICQIPINRKNTTELAKTFGAIALHDERMKTVCELLVEMIDKDSIKRLWAVIKDTQNIPIEKSLYTGGNVATLLQLKGESFIGANLENTVLYGAIFSNTDFSLANLEGICLREAQMLNCNLKDVNMRNSDLSFMKIKKCNLIGSDMEGCDLTKAKLDYNLMSNINMKNAKLNGIEIEDPKIESFAWSMDGNYIAAGVSDGGIRIWETNTWELICTLRDNLKQNNFISFNSVDSDILVSLLDANSIAIWNIQKCLQLQLMTNEETMSNRLYFSPSGKYISSSHGESGNITIWDVNTGAQLTSFEAQKGWSNAAVFLLDEEKILSTGYGGDIRIWNWKTKKLISSYDIENAGNAYDLQLSSNQERICAIATIPKDSDDFGHADYHKVYVWTFPDFKQLFTLGFNKNVDDICYSPDGLLVAVLKNSNTNNNNNFLHLYKVDDDKKPIILLKDYSNYINDILFSANNRYLASYEDSIIRIWDVNFDSSTFSKCINLLETKANCEGMYIGNASGLEQEIEEIIRGGEQNITLLKFLTERGAVLE